MSPSEMCRAPSEGDPDGTQDDGTTLTHSPTLSLKEATRVGHPLAIGRHPPYLAKGALARVGHRSTHTLSRETARRTVRPEGLSLLLEFARFLFHAARQLLLVGFQL